MLDDELEYDYADGWDSDWYIEGGELMHYGVGHDKGGHSGRYPWGSGDAPYQRDGFLQEVRQLKREGWTENQIAEKFEIFTLDRKKNKIPSIKKLRIQISMAEEVNREKLVEKAEKLRAEGKSLNQIAEEMGYKNDSSVRSLLNVGAKSRMAITKNVYNELKRQVDESPYGMLDVGKNVNLYIAGNANASLGISQEKLDTALYMLELEGYNVYGGGVPQATNKGKQTNMRVLCTPEVEHKDIFNYSHISSLDSIESHDGGESFIPSFVEPKALERNRIWIREPKDGGAERDGTIELRRGVKDIDLGEGCNYAQVRIRTDNGYYLKGMAVYGDDKEFPEGVDVIFNSSKPDGSPDSKHLKALKTKKATDEKGRNLKDAEGKPIEVLDVDNMFGALLKPGIQNPDEETGRVKRGGGQSYYIDENGEKQLSVINKTREERDWDEWSKGCPSQFLAKQSPTLVKNQLAVTMAEKDAQFEEINQLDNPTIKKKMMADFADACDKDAKTLKAASLPGLAFQVVLPGRTLKNNEIYAPNFQDGDTIALVRFPHSGKFEIPILTVNNNNQQCRDAYGTQANDMIAINAWNAGRLSGADFDGDTALAIPCNSARSRVRILGNEILPGLEGFDNKHEYPYREGMKIMSKENTGKEMGKIANLITDMQVKGATNEELARAVRHSMVVIDAAKHKLDYERSYTDNDIASLKEKYQRHIEVDPITGEAHVSFGASTLLSKAKSEVSVKKRQGSPIIDPETGEKTWKDADPEKLYYHKYKVIGIDPDTGREIRKYSEEPTIRTQQSTKMDEAKDAMELVSDVNNVIEVAYAEYANHMKSLANKARMASLSENTGRLLYDPEAKEKYQEEYDSIREKLKVAEMNAPRERKAQFEANAAIDAYIKNHTPSDDDDYEWTEDDKLSKKDEKKYRQIALNKAREKYGADGKGTRIHLTDNEWDAIQKGAITESILSRVLTHMDKTELMQRATPKKESMAMTNAQINRFKALKVSGYTIAQIAEQVGVSPTTVRKYLKGGD